MVGGGRALLVVYFVTNNEMEFYLEAHSKMPEVLRAKDRKQFLIRGRMSIEIEENRLKYELKKLDKKKEQVDKLLRLLQPPNRDIAEPPSEPDTMWMGDDELHWATEMGYFIQRRRCWTYKHKPELYSELIHVETLVHTTHFGAHQFEPTIKHPNAEFLARVLACESKRHCKYWIEQRDTLFD